MHMGQHTMDETPRSPDRARILIKLRALLAKTVDNGCTEAEALSAAEKASAIMEEYDLSYTDVEQVRTERFGARRRPFGKGTSRRRSYHEATMCHHSISKLFDCRAWYSSGDLVFFGSEHDSEAAHYMADVCRVAMDSEFARYLASPARDRSYHGRTLRTAFMTGMARRISARLDEMKAQRENRAKIHAQATGNALVVVAKREIVTEKYEIFARETNHKLRGRVGSGRSIRSHGAYEAGKSAGDRVALNPAIGGTRKQIKG
jgi:hypothetical protein